MVNPSMLSQTRRILIVPTFELGNHASGVDEGNLVRLSLPLSTSLRYTVDGTVLGRASQR